MSALRISLAALLVLSACDGNPFSGTGTGTDGGGTSASSVSDLPGTSDPKASSSVTRFEDENKGPDGSVTGNGYAFQDGKYQYDAAKDTFTVDNLAFDGGNVYTRDNTIPTVGPAKVYKSATKYADDQTGVQIDQFSYRALYGVSKTGRTQFAIVRTGAYVPYGFGGFIYSRTGGVTLPKDGQAEYSGTYAGLRDFDGQGGLQYTTGDMTMAIDFNDFNANESKTGNGAGIQGYVTNRRIFDLAGNDITSSVIAGINDDKNLTTNAINALPTLVFKVGPGVLDNNGEAEGQLNSTIPTSSGGSQVFESGKYYAVISGTKADEVAGVIVVTSNIGDVTARETGGFILYRP